ncbi:flagellar hook-associated protein 3 [Photobacterium gaetbulicola]|uniref:Putative flagellar hook-associated protein FlgL n=1 Tax=Photobacterium gaetbulicola Gung47 TaxID=658445 RepID=A0A0C5WKX1_9GAMM|nr:flagellar hook-associated protein FlgL [Photobacterium gaetbulicola]AJR07803.1 putative flagellar hook-associated protein FlgL [Photobacterium gaetbulicola Gung47]PSU03402.1 flagellar hook-associated protein 3 [Photobacterium gaetbulicola]
MRVSTNQYSQMMSGSLSQNSLGINKIMQQMATGKRLLVPSDDPMASTRVMSLKREQASIGQYLGNIEQADVALKKQETYLSSAVDVLHQMRDLMLWAGNDTNGPDERAAMANELEHLQDSLVSLVNAKDENGKYIFSGNEVNTQPLVKDDDGNWIYQGDTGVREVVVGDGVTIQLNVNAEDMFFSGGTDIFNQLDELVVALRDPGYDLAASDIIERSVDVLDETLMSVSGTVTSLGSRQNSLTTMQDGHSEVELFNNDLIGQLEDLDYADAMVQYNNYLLALQATQATYVKTASLSLFSIM